MRYLKLFENFDEIDRMCQQYNIQNYVINQDGSIDVDGYVNLWRQNLTKLPLKFNKVRGNFYCNHNQLTSLKGCPSEVGGEFHCGINRLTTLVGGPRKVVGDYYCKYNKLMDVRGFPEYLGRIVYMAGNPVTDITFLVPSIVEEKFIFWLNEYDVIRDGFKIVEMRLEEAYWMTTKTELTDEQKDTITKYRFI